MSDYNDYDDFEWNEDHEDTSDIYEDLHNLIQEIRNDIANLPKERPIFSDKQVLSPEDLEVGKKYIHWHKNESCEQIVISEPYKTDSGNDAWFFMVRSVSYNFEYEQSLADCGIIPYASGGWNDTNYMTIE